MYATSFRIPLTNLFGTNLYINGCFFSKKPYNRGQKVSVYRLDGNSPVSFDAEVLESCRTQKGPSDFGWVKNNT